MVNDIVNNDMMIQYIIDIISFAISLCKLDQ